METNYINIVLTADSNYTEVIGVTMVSVLANLSKEKTARFFIFSQNFTEDDLNKLNTITRKYPCEIVNIPVDEYLKYFELADTNKFKNQWISLACYFRLLLFKFLPDDVKQCFYVDGDMIVDCDLSTIILRDEKIFAATVESCAMQDRETILEHCYNLIEFKNFKHEPLKYPYFNAGFFLVDIEQAKKLGIFEQLIDLLKKYPELPYCDQDLLNMLYGQKYSDKLQILPCAYNVFADIDYDMTYDKLPYPDSVLKKAVQKPLIYHYAGARKPWATIDLNHYFDKWWEYYAKTPWVNDWRRKKFNLWFKSPIKGPRRIVYNIFSLLNQENHKVLTILGVKFKFRRKIEK